MKLILSILDRIFSLKVLSRLTKHTSFMLNLAASIIVFLPFILKVIGVFRYSGIIQVVFMLLAGALILLAIMAAVVTQRVIKKDIGFCIIGVLFVFLYSLIISPSTIAILSMTLFEFTSIGICSYIIVRYVQDFDALINIMKKFSYVAVAILLLEPFFWIFSDITYMSYSYLLLLPALILSYSAFKYKKAVDIVFSAVAAFLIIMFGSRGMFLSLVFAYCVFSFVTFRKALTKIIGTLGTFAVLISLLFTLPLYLTPVVEKISEKTIEFKQTVFSEIENKAPAGNLYKRQKNIIESGQLFYDSGRRMFFEVGIDIIKKHPLFGVGIAKDKTIIKTKITEINPARYSGYPVKAFYPHNLMIELLVQFGIPLGIIIFSGFVYLIIRAGLISYGETSFFLLTIFISSYIIRLAFSGSYLSYSNYFLLVLGLCVTIIENKRLQAASEKV